MGVLNLQKGDLLDLRKPEYSNLRKVTIGLGWRTHLDLDSIAILLDTNGNRITTVSYRNLMNVKNYGVGLSGDDLVGGKKGDCEQVFIDLDKLSDKVKHIDIYCNIFSSGNTFDEVSNAYIRLFNSEDNEEIAIHNLTNCENARNTNAVFFASLEISNGSIIVSIKSESIGNGIDIETINNLYTKSTLKTSDIKTSNESNSRTSCEPTRTTESRIQAEPVKKGFFTKVKEFFS